MIELLCIETHPDGIVIAGKTYPLLGEIQTSCCGQKSFDVGAIGKGTPYQYCVCGSVFTKPVDKDHVRYVGAWRFAQIGTEDEHATYETQKELA